jgi:hypothetical protein
LFPVAANKASGNVDLLKSKNILADRFSEWSSAVPEPSSLPSPLKGRRSPKRVKSIFHPAGFEVIPEEFE